jgi:3',5'-cyclic AMP phosphodiesterase CpdA
MRRIAHISDLHFGRYDPAVAEGLLAALARVEPHLVAISGDLTQRAHRREFTLARAFLDRIKSPILVVPGNHDVPLYNLFDRFFRPHARFARFVDAQRYPRFVDDEIAVLGLNTAWGGIGVEGRLTGDHLAAIRDGFADIPDSAFKVLVTHHPLLDPTDGPMLVATHGARRVLGAIAAAGVKLLLAGHHHRPFSAAGTIDYLALRRSILIVQAGTAISTRLRGGPNSFNVVEIAGERVDCTPHNWQGGAFRAGETALFVYDGARWAIAAADIPQLQERASG